MEGHVKRRSDYRLPHYLVKETNLCFDIYAAYVEVTAELKIEQHPQVSGSPALFFDGNMLELQWLELNGKKLSHNDYNYDGKVLEIFSPQAQFTLRSCVRINPYTNKTLSGFYLSGDILCSQNEAEGFRNITFFPDRPDVMSVFSCEIIADQQSYPCLLSNGNMIESKELDGGRHAVKWHDPFPKPCYLFAIVAGRLDHISDTFITCSGRTVDLRIYTDPGKSHLATFAMKALKESMRWDEQRFGREYDLDLFMIVAVVSFNFGAMENKGLNIFNSHLIYADPQLASDDDYIAISGVIAHEYFHNWTGNRITCRDWFQLTLKEGLTVYRDEEFSADLIGPTLQRLEDVRYLRAIQYPEDNGPNCHPIRPESYLQIENFYTATVYRKGAAVIRMIANYLGKEKFRQGMDVYFEKFDGMAICCDDFLDALEEGSGISLESLRRWYSQVGTPRIKVAVEMEGDDALLHCQQIHTPQDTNVAAVGIPFPLSVYDQNGQLILESNPLLTEAEETLRFEGVGSKAVFSLFKGHAAPVILEYEQQEKELLLLLECDQDPFNRYEAAQRYYKNVILGTSKLNADDKLFTILQSILHDRNLAPAYRAEFLSLPSLQELSDSQTPPDFEQLYQSKLSLERQLADFLQVSCKSMVEELFDSDASFSPQRASKRKLRMRLFSLLALLGKETHALVLSYYHDAVNITERMAALRLLHHHYAGEETDKLVGEFGEKWQDELLVFCKWLRVQASCVAPDTLLRAQRLSKHPCFNRESPNIMRALYYVFSANLPVFHQASGSGYEFLADAIISSDSYNPQMAAGLAKRFFAYPRLTENLQGHMARQLQRILDTEGLSNSTYEPIQAILKSKVEV